MAETVGPGFADVKSVKALVKEMPDQFLECREGQHSVRPYTAREIPKAERKNYRGAKYERVKRCSSCNLDVIDYLSALGERIGQPVRRYPEGYLLPKGFGRITGSARNVLRVASVTRLFETIQAG